MGRYTETFTEEQEKAILTLYITRPFSDTFGVYDTLPPEQFATLGASFSRSHERFEERLMKTIEKGDLRLPNFGGLFIDPRNADPKQFGLLARVMTASTGAGSEESHQGLVQDIHSAMQTGEVVHSNMLGLPEELSGVDPQRFLLAAEQLLVNWRVPPEQARHFIQKWAQQYGHNSIKEMANLRMVCENIPDITGKPITGHPLNHPQVKSTRYLEWSNIIAMAEQNRDIVESPHAELMIGALRNTATAYEQIAEGLERFGMSFPLNQEFLEWKAEQTGDRDAAERLLRGNVHKSVLDSARYLLTPAIPTSLAFSVDCRTLESVVTVLLSSKMLEDQRVGQEIWNQARLATPVLMGEKCHAGVSEYAVKTRQALEELLPGMFSFERERGYEAGPRVQAIQGVEGHGDARVAAAACWVHGHGSFSQYFAHLVANPQDTKRVIDALFEHRQFEWDGAKDPLHPALNHHGDMAEILMDYGGDRDLHRHRRGASTTQELSIYHGVETPEEIEAAGLKEVFDRAIQEIEKVHRVVREDSPHTAQLMTAFAHRRRRLVSWSPEQVGYVVELRTKREGHDSYRGVTTQLSELHAEKYPILAEHINVDERSYPTGLAKAARNWHDSKRQ